MPDGDKSPPSEIPAEQPDPQPVDPSFPLVLNLHGELRDGDDPAAWWRARPKRPEYTPLNYETCYLPSYEPSPEGGWRLSIEAFLEWCNWNIWTMEVQENWTSTLQSMREDSGGPDVRDAYRLVEVVKQQGAGLELQEPPGKFTPHDALRELRKVRDALLLRKTGEPDDPDSSEGREWTFRPGEAEFVGHRIAISGPSWRILKVLAESKYAVKRAELKDAASPEIGIEDSTLRGYLSEIRHLLRTEFGTTADPIPHVDVRELSAWRLDSSVLRPA